MNIPRLKTGPYFEILKDVHEFIIIRFLLWRVLILDDNFFWSSHTTELDKWQLNRRVLMSRPREDSRKILRKISSVFIGDNVIFA